MNWHLRCPNTQCPALAQALERSTGHVHAVNSNLPVHSLQTDRKKTEQKANKEKVLRLQQSHIHYLSPSTQLAAAYYSSSSSARAGSSISYTANGCVSLLPQPDVLLCTHSYCGVHICEFYTACVHECRCVSMRSSLKHNVLQALAAGGFLVSAIVEKRVDLPDSWLTVLPLRLPQQAVVGDSLCVAAFQRVVGR